MKLQWEINVILILQVEFLPPHPVQNNSLVNTGCLWLLHEVHISSPTFESKGHRAYKLYHVNNRELRHRGPHRLKIELQTKTLTLNLFMIPPKIGHSLSSVIYLNLRLSMVFLTSVLPLLWIHIYIHIYTHTYIYFFWIIFPCVFFCLFCNTGRPLWQTLDTCRHQSLHWGKFAISHSKHPVLESIIRK